jgi:hypothetical protein
VKVEVHINGHEIYSEPVNLSDVQPMAERLAEMYNIDLLKLVGIRAEICISGVQSKMNYPWFEVKQEWYDRLVDPPLAHAI